MGLQRPCVKHLRHSYHGEDPSPPQNVHVSKSGTSPPCPSPQDHDVKLKNGTFFPSWENRLASKGGLGCPSHHQGRPSHDLSHLACGPLASNLWACSPMEAQARLVLPKLSTN
jgi:hypothetical protein